MSGWKENSYECRVCGCIDEDCSGCIDETGYACHWVEDDLCSRCAGKPIPWRGDRLLEDAEPLTEEKLKGFIEELKNEDSAPRLKRLEHGNRSGKSWMILAAANEYLQAGKKVGIQMNGIQRNYVPGEEIKLEHFYR